jgi:tripartite-type tricarboxylate transporter receptor subunit TctC
MNSIQRGRRKLLAAAGALALPTISLSSRAESVWPDHAVKLIVPFTPGGPTDVVARLVSAELGEIWKQPVIVDYKPGAGTIVGTQFVARAPADGYTLGMAITALMINPGLQPSLPYDTKKDLTGVSQIALSHFGVFAHPSVPFNDAAGLIAYAKKNPGKLSYATPGVGTGTHLAGEMLCRMAGIEMLHVPYKGSAPAQQDVIAGRVPLLFDVMFSVMPFVRDGQLKAIALASPRRAVSEPQIGLIADVVPGFSAMSYIGIIAPAGIPQPLLHHISADIAQAVKTPALTARMAELGSESVGSTPEAYNAAIASESDKWSRLIKEANIKVE